jgi:hypothetical protein
MGVSFFWTAVSTREVYDSPSDTYGTEDSTDWRLAQGIIFTSIGDGFVEGHGWAEGEMWMEIRDDGRGRPYIPPGVPIALLFNSASSVSRPANYRAK